MDNIDGVPEATWVPDVDPSMHDAATAYVVFEDHRRGNWTPYIYRTTDYGESWERLGEEIDGFVHAVAEDPEEPGLLFAGTEFGLWFSTNGGNDWQQWTSGVPSVPIRDLIVHPRDGDLVLGTHGRGALVIDDIRPLRALAAGAVTEGGGPVLVEPPPALAVDIAEAIGYRSTGHAMQQGEMRPYGAVLSFWHSGDAEGRLEISDAAGAVAYTDDLNVHAGVNRVTWNLSPEETSTRTPSSKRWRCCRARTRSQ